GRVRIRPRQALYRTKHHQRPSEAPHEEKGPSRMREKTTIIGRRSLLAATAAVPAALALPRPALSQGQWPAGRAIELIVGFAPGGGTDVMLRALAGFLAAELPGANFVVLNRPGAGGETAYVAIQSARPDGYTIGAINTPGYISVPIE